jgi:hypothetical protein
MANGYFDARGLFGTTPEELQREIFDKSQQRRAKEMQFLASNTLTPGYTYGMLQSLEPLRQQYANRGEDPRVQQLRSQVGAAQEALQGFDMETPEGISQAASKLMQMGMIEQATKLLSLAKAKRDAKYGIDKQQFGSSTQWKDTEGNYFSGTQIRDPASGKVRYDVVPVGDAPEEPVGKLTRIGGSYGETSADALARKTEELLAGRIQKVEGAREQANITALRELGDKDIYPAAKQAYADIGRYDAMDTLLNDIETGGIADFVTRAKGLGKYLGVTDEVIGSEETFRALALKDAMRYVNETKGAISNMEMILFERASPNLGNSVEGNRLLIAFAKHIAQRKANLADEYAKWVQEHPKGTPEQWQLHQRKWVEKQEQFLLDDEKLSQFRSSKTADSKKAESEKLNANMENAVSNTMALLDKYPDRQAEIMAKWKETYPNTPFPIPVD